VDDAEIAISEAAASAVTRPDEHMARTAKENTVVYAYGVVPAGFDVARAPAGIDDATVILLGAGRFAALASRLPADAYDASRVERSSGEVAWLSPRAQAHDRVLTWAQDRGGVVPMPMFSLWRSERALTASLDQRAAELDRVFARVAGADEFGLRVHRRDAEMVAHAHELDPAVAELRRAAAAASPGQRYLLERKLADQSKAAARAASQRIAREVFDGLRGIAREALARPLTPTQATPPDATLVLNGAFLVDRVRGDEFRAAVAARMRECEPLGLVFDFTGPWPPYNFAT